jgi:predicted nuclease with TOPRIM domain
MESEQFQILIGIDNKVHEVKEKLHGIELVQTRMEGDLKYHIKRTDLLEEQLNEVSDQVKPVETFKSFLTFTAKMVAFFTSLAIAVGTVLKITSKN